MCIDEPDPLNSRTHHLSRSLRPTLAATSRGLIYGLMTRTHPAHQEHGNRIWTDIWLLYRLAASYYEDGNI